MKKKLCVLIVITMLVGLTACGNEEQPVKEEKMTTAEKLGTESGITPQTGFVEPDLDIDPGAKIATTEVPSEEPTTKARFTETMETVTSVTTEEQSEAVTEAKSEESDEPVIMEITDDYSRFEGVYHGKGEEIMYMVSGTPYPEGKKKEFDNEVVCACLKGVPITFFDNHKIIIADIARDKQLHLDSFMATNPLKKLTFDKNTCTSVYSYYIPGGITSTTTTTFSESPDGSITAHIEREQVYKDGTVLIVDHADYKKVSSEYK